MRDALIKEYIGMVHDMVSWAGRRNPSWREEFYGCGYVALVEAVDRWIELGCKGSCGAYVRTCVRQALFNEVSHSFVVGVSSSTLYRGGGVNCVGLVDVGYDSFDSVEFKELIDLTCRNDQERLVMDRFLAGCTLKEIGSELKCSISKVQQIKTILLDRWFYYWSL